MHASHPGDRPRVLLVEDEAGDAELFREALRDTRFRIDHVETLGAAVERLGEQPFDVVALDLNLPDGGGVEGFRRVDAAAAAVPVVVLTGTDDSELALELIHEGAQDYLVKWDLSAGLTQRALEYAIERKAVELQLERAREEALASSAAKSAFVAAMSHEIRTPLNAILGVADLLLETPLDEEQREYVRLFHRSGKSLLDLLNNVLELSRIESGAVEIDPAPFDPAALVEDVVETFGFVAHKKRLFLAQRIDPGLPSRVSGDDGRIRQVLTNLIGNAVKFTERGGVSVRVERGEDSLLVFQVVDTGDGVAPDELENIFGRFVQTEVGSRTHGGSGLGLSLCRELIECMDGRIEAGLGPEGGLSMRFELPLPEVEPVKPLEPLLAGQRVLVVDDADEERAALVEMVESLGGVATPRGSLDEAWSALSGPGQPFDTLLLDARMPDGSGLEVATWLAKQDAWRGRCLVLLPRDHRLGDVGRCRQVGASPLAKPVRRSAFEGILRGEPDDTMDMDADTQPDALAGVRILVADDCVENRALLQAFLRNSGCQIEIAVDGGAALEQFRKGTFDLVLMDVQMPVMDGYEATRAIRHHEQEQGLSPTPILALTANAFAEDALRSEQAGCNAHIAKPVDKRTLLGTLAKHLCLGKVRVVPDASIADLVPEYLENRAADVAAMREGLADDAFEDVRRLAHNMKGTGSPYGFPDITRIGAVIERAAKLGDADQARAGISELEIHLERVELVDPLDDVTNEPSEEDGKRGVRT